MAKVFPSGWREVNPLADIGRELETLELLGNSLDDSYTVYHGVHWTNVESKNYAIYGEIDFAVVSPSGKLLLIEQKTGYLDETDDGLEKKYAEKSKNVPFQIARNAHGLQHRLKQALKGNSVFVDSILYCPDYKIKKLGSAGIDPKRIVDSTRKDQLVSIIQSIIPAEEPNTTVQELLHQFLSDLLEIVPDVNAVIGQTDKLYTRVSGGLSEWAQKIDFTPFRLRVIGTAGSGKTQLALSVFRESIKQGRKPLYVCYNRSLADHVSKVAPEGGLVTGYHQLGDRIAKLLGTPIDHLKPGPFAQMEATLDSYQPSADQLFDDLIVDEGQDFKPNWAANLMRLLRPDGKAWWLEDPLQNVYSREQISFDSWVTIRSEANFRSPKRVLSGINELLQLNPPIVSCSPIEGGEVEVLTYESQSELIPRTVEALDRAVELGFESQHIALLSFRGRESSVLTPFTQIGQHTLRSPIQGKYDELGNPEYAEGEITTDSVHRFKGQAAPCVVLTEIDFAQMDENSKIRIFVGATRATMKLILVISDRALKVLLNQSTTL
jgi:UvrD-like helicase C-terminal domain/Nuclease-related domain